MLLERGILFVFGTGVTIYACSGGYVLATRSLGVGNVPSYIYIHMMLFR